MDVDLQLKSPNLPGEDPGISHAIQAVIPYTSKDGAWQHIQARLDQFVQPTFLARFDPNNVLALVINFEMKEKGVVYDVEVDNVYWDGPEVTVPGATLATYLSSNDSAAPPPDADQDGLPDSAETGTGVYVSPTNTGTRPNQADSDGDGQPDGEEVAAGTNPNSALDVFRIESIHWSESGVPVLVWKARAGRYYSLSFADELGNTEFFPVPECSNLTVPSDRQLEVQDAASPPSGSRFYRLEVRTP